MGCAKNLRSFTVDCLPPVPGKGSLPTHSPRFSHFTPADKIHHSESVLLLPCPKDLPLLLLYESLNFPALNHVGPRKAYLWVTLLFFRTFPPPWPKLSSPCQHDPHTSAVPAPYRGPGAHKVLYKRQPVQRRLPSALFAKLI